MAADPLHVSTDTHVLAPEQMAALIRHRAPAPARQFLAAGAWQDMPRVPWEAATPGSLYLEREQPALNGYVKLQHCANHDLPFVGAWSLWKAVPARRGHAPYAALVSDGDRRDEQFAVIWLADIFALIEWLREFECVGQDYWRQSSWSMLERVIEEHLHALHVDDPRGVPKPKPLRRRGHRPRPQTYLTDPRLVNDLDAALTTTPQERYVPPGPRRRGRPPKPQTALVDPQT